MQEEVTFLKMLLQEAGGTALTLFYDGVRQVRHKYRDIDLVTEADLAVEELLLDRLRDRFPTDSILAEESGLNAGSDRRWVVDPIDGTTNFAHGYPVFGISIGLYEWNNLLLGVTRCPILRQTCWATAGGGAWAQEDGEPPRRLQVSGTAKLGQALLSTGFPYTRAENPDNNLQEFNVILPRVQGIRRGGAATVDLCWLADGRLDGYWEANLKPWDWVAGALLIREAGGTVTNYAGEPWQPGDMDMVASNGYIHDQLLAIVQGVRREL